jgi:hypothetical protein
VAGMPLPRRQRELLCSVPEGLTARRAAYHASIRIALAMIVGGLLKLLRLIRPQPLTS